MLPKQHPALRTQWSATHRPKAPTARKTPVSAVSAAHVTVMAVIAANAMVKPAKTVFLKKFRPILQHRQTCQLQHKPKSGRLAVHTLNVHKLQLRQRQPHLQQHRTVSFQRFPKLYRWPQQPHLQPPWEKKHPPTRLHQRRSLHL
jgi:hypothetical protein